MRIFEAILLGMIAVLALASTSVGAGIGSDEISTLRISGIGEMTADADIVTIVMGVQTRDASAAVAVEDNGRMMAATIDSLLAAGVPQEEIKTSRFSIRPTRDWIDGRLSDEVAFEVSNQVTFTLDLADEMDIGAIIDGAIGAGANIVESVTFGLRDPAPVTEGALEEAVADAMGKARVVSQAAGVDLGRILSISEGIYSPGPMTETRMFLTADAGVMTPIIPGDIKVEATVTITYEILTGVVAPPDIPPEQVE